MRSNEILNVFGVNRLSSVPALFVVSSFCITGYIWFIIKMDVNVNESKKNKKVSIWNKETLTMFLETFEGFPCLYDPKNKFYSNKHARADALNQIKDSLGQPDLTVDEIKTKINNVRTQISHELKKTRETHSGLGTDEVYEPVWWFDLAQFLIPFVRPRKGEDNLGNTQEIQKDTQEFTKEDSLSDEDSMATDESQFNISTPSTSTAKSAKIKKIVPDGDVTYSKTMETLQVLNTNILKVADRRAEDKKEMEFASFIAKELGDINDPELLLDAKFEISNIIYKYKKACLNKQKEISYEFVP